jgi:hypothetical protein
MKTLKFTEKVEGLSSIFKHPQVIGLFKPYEASEIKKREVLLRKLKRSKVVAYFVPVDPAQNYNRPFRIFYKLETYECTFLNEMEVGGSITSAPLRVISIEEDTINFSDTFYPNDDVSRKWVKETGLIVGRF